MDSSGEPTTLSYQVLAQLPNLADSDYEVTSPLDDNYNCIAWAASVDTTYWWPDEMGQAYWPDNIERKATTAAFKAAYRTIGYVNCDSPELIDGTEKIAIYVDENNVPLHAARQLENGQWTSKLGPNHDIQHTLEGLEDGVYGKVGFYMKRWRH